MKTIRKIGMALFAILMSVNFAACSEDEEEEDVPQYELLTDGKKLTKIEYTLSDSYNDFIEIWNFSYDNEGKLLEATFTDSYGNRTKGKYTWDNNEIYENGYSYKLKNGLVQNWHNIKYNEKNRPIEVMGTTYKWSYDELIEQSTAYSNGNVTRYDFTAYYYNGKECTGFNPLIPMVFTSDTDFLFIVHPEIVGMRSTQIPSSFLDHDIISGMTQGTYSHKLDNEGYLSEFRMKYNGERYEYIYTMTWE